MEGQDKKLNRRKDRNDNKIASLGLGAPLLRPSCDLGWTSRGFSKHNTKMDNMLTMLVLMFAEPSATL